MKREITPEHPSRRATARVKNPLPVPEICHYCEGKVIAVRNREIYGRDYGDWPWMYLCTNCRAYVGIHPFTAIPLGTLADQETRDARKRAKPIFERLFRSGRMTRDEAYTALAERMGIEPEACHFGWFDVEQCQQAEQAAREIFLGVVNVSSA